MKNTSTARNSEAALEQNVTKQTRFALEFYEQFRSRLSQNARFSIQRHRVALNQLQWTPNQGLG
jgi:hypothetical protein